MRDMGELRDLLVKSSAAMGFLKDWMESRRSGFGVARKDQDAVWSKQMLWTYINNLNTLTAEELELALPLPRDLECANGTARGCQLHCHHGAIDGRIPGAV